MVSFYAWFQRVERDEKLVINICLKYAKNNKDIMNLNMESDLQSEEKWVKLI